MPETKGVVARSAGPDEVHTAALIQQIAFKTDRLHHWSASCDWLASNRGLDYVVTAEADGKMVSSLICTPGEVRFGDDVLSFSAVGSVATLPDYRQRGCAAAIMDRAVRVLHDHGHHTSALWPFSYAYYRKFGWELASEHRSYRIPLECARSLGDPTGSRPALHADIPGITRLAERFARKRNCVTVRDTGWWEFQQISGGFRMDGGESPCENPGSTWVHETGGEIDAYCVFEMKPDEKDCVTRIPELMADSNAARNSLVARMAAMEPKEIVLIAPVDDGLLQELADPRSLKCEMQPGFQFRLVNPQAAFDGLIVPPELTGALNLWIGDRVLGDHSFCLEASCGRTATGKPGRGETVRGTVQAFSQVFTGYLRPFRAAELGRLEATREALALFEQFIPHRLPFRSWVELG